MEHNAEREVNAAEARRERTTMRLFASRLEALLDEGSQPGGWDRIAARMDAALAADPTLAAGPTLAEILDAAPTFED